jgi:hypothetical protein
MDLPYLALEVTLYLEPRSLNRSRNPIDYAESNRFEMMGSEATQAVLTQLDVTPETGSGVV